MTRITDKEREILEALASGLTQKEIAYRKNIPLRTVKHHILELKLKLDCDNVFQLGMKYPTLARKGNENLAA